MKRSELLRFKKLYYDELERIKRIKELLNTKDCIELINSINLNVDEYKNKDDLTVLESILKDFEVTETNGIYVCTGSFITDYDGSYEDTRYYAKKVLFNSSYTEYKLYRDIESCKTIRAYTKPELLEHYRVYYGDNLAKDFEKNNIVLNPHNSNENSNGFNEVRNEFFMNCINFGQTKSKKLILEKHKRM